MDRRVRPSHAILDGKVYPADHEFWATHYPPNGFRCRCGVRTLKSIFIFVFQLQRFNNKKLRNSFLRGGIA